MSFKDIFKKSFLEGFTAMDISTSKILATLAMVVILSLYIFCIYRVVTRKTFYSKTFNISLAAIAIITASIILAMQSNLVISLGMVGALSIVRYRTAIKDPMDLLYLFWSISVGITLGAGLYVLAIATMLIMVAVVHLFYNRRKKGTIFILVAHYESELAGDEILRILNKMKHQLKSKTIRGELTELTIELVCRNNNTLFMEQIQAVEGVRDVSLIQYNGEYHG